MIAYRCFAWEQSSAAAAPDGPLWFPQSYQGEGRHDNPDLYGCLYLSERPVSCIVEQLARFRTQRLSPALLNRRGLPLALAAIELDARAQLVDFDDPQVLSRERLRPSLVATRDRQLTQPQARAIYTRRPAAAGVKWWSIFEATWVNYTVFDRAAPRLHLQWVRILAVGDPPLVDAAQFFGMRTAEQT